MVYFVILLILISILALLWKLGYLSPKLTAEEKVALDFSAGEMVRLYLAYTELKDYVTFEDVDCFKAEHLKSFERIKGSKALLKIDNYEQFCAGYKGIEKFALECNKRFVEKELNEQKALLSNIDNKALDPQQSTVVVVDETNHLVLAGAGSGKTLTIAGKVKYLVNRKKVNPANILLISFTKKSADEMYERIRTKLGIEVQVNTFHKLGLDIIAEKKGFKPDIVESAEDIVNEAFNELMSQDKTMMTYLLEFFAYYLQIPKKMDEFSSKEAYHEYYQNLDYTTFRGYGDKVGSEAQTNDLAASKITYRGERVKSLEELQIANFLFLNGVAYEYEKPYPIKSADLTHRQYRPDFYLREYDLYIEHFGIDEKGNLPQYSAIEETKYKEEMVWKREFHKTNGTKLLETYSYYSSQGSLLEELKKLLLSKGVKFKPIGKSDLFIMLSNRKKDKQFIEFKRLMVSFLSLFKSKGYNEASFVSLETEIQRDKRPFNRERAKVFFGIFIPIYRFYESKLKESGQIDFNDMINHATQCIDQGEVVRQYSYIIIDEYQDISYSRYKLIQAIKKQTKAKLLCVGDDWQSIYRFAGSDISLFANFEDHFGRYHLSKIEQTYRNSQDLIDIAGEFVTANQSQLKKNLRSQKNCADPIEIIGYSQNGKEAALEHALQKIVQIDHEGAEVLLIGRNNFDIEFLESSSRFRLKRLKEGVVVQSARFSRLKIKYLTAHRSKGLEADHVIIINGEDAPTGFPNKMADDPLLTLVLTKADNFGFAEERRLFYVAMTRTKNKTYILTPDAKRSVFVKELMKKHTIPYDKTLVTASVTDQPACPKCLVGSLMERVNEKTGKSFLACSSYPLCNTTFSDTQILQKKILCIKCGSYMMRKKGKKGSFYGCANYPTCGHTMDWNG